MGSLLPETLRPRGVFHREFIPGLDLPSWFYYDLKAIDGKLHIIYHPYRVMWDDIINQYEGPLDDSRFSIHYEHGQENWGFVLKQSGSDAPIEEASWHVWRLCEPYGWAHIVKIEAREGKYLELLTSRLNLQARFTDKYGHHAWNRKTEADTSEMQEKAQDDKDDMMDAVMKENEWLTKKARENFQRGQTAPTNPQISKIISYPGQKNKSRTVRALSDTEGGLVIPE